jgi:hypothetical protein
MISSSFYDEFRKLAADEKKSPVKDIAKIIGMGLLGTATGAAVGFGGAELADRTHKFVTGQSMPRSYALAALPALGALGGVAYSMHRAKEQEGIRRVLQDSAEHGAGRAP